MSMLASAAMYICRPSFVNNYILGIDYNIQCMRKTLYPKEATTLPTTTTTTNKSRNRNSDEKKNN